MFLKRIGGMQHYAQMSVHFLVLFHFGSAFCIHAEQLAIVGFLISRQLLSILLVEGGLATQCLGHGSDLSFHPLRFDASSSLRPSHLLTTNLPFKVLTTRVWFFFKSRVFCMTRRMQNKKNNRTKKSAVAQICHQRIWRNMDPWWTKSRPEVLLHHAIIFLWMSHNSKQRSIRFGWVAFDFDLGVLNVFIGFGACGIMLILSATKESGETWIRDGPNHNLNCFYTMQSSFYGCHTTQTKLHHRYGWVIFDIGSAEQCLQRMKLL